MTLVQTSPDVAQNRPSPSRGAAERGLRVAGVALVVAVGVAVRTWNPSALWLDESLSVSIASLPPGELQEALRRDGAPPVYSLLLWGWERLFGQQAGAVRLLSAIFGIAALPLAALAGRRLAGTTGAVAALLLLATSPFAVAYSTEARMYSLVVLLVLSGHLVLDDFLQTPGPRRGLVLALVTAGLALTHYWSLFLLAVLAAVLVASGRRLRSPQVQAVGWMAAGGVLFLPWLPTFLFQTAHTSTPWGVPAPYSAVLSTVTEWTGGVTTTARLLAVVLLVLAALGVTAVASGPTQLEIDLRGRPPGRRLALVVGGTLVLALTVGKLTGAAFAGRYTSVVFPLFLLLAAVGVSRLPRALQTPVLVVAVIAGLAGAVNNVVSYTKTSAPVLAEALQAEALPADLVVYCPDQLGPSMSRLLPATLEQEVYPSGAPPARVDWIDYTERNRQADPVAYARGLAQRGAGRVIWVVSHDGYRTFEGQCQSLAHELTLLRGQPLVLAETDPLYFEEAALRGWAPPQ